MNSENAETSVAEISFSPSATKLISVTTQVLIKACHVDVVQKRIIAIEPLPLFKQLFMEFFADIGVVIL